MNDYLRILNRIIDEADIEISNIKPSDWCEQNRFMTPDISPIPGPFRYDNSPYSREIVDCLSPDHPSRIIAVMKGAQIGFALDVNTPITTPKGWSKMGALKVGDYVFDENGKPCKIIKATDTMYNHKCYDVHFSDGSVIKCDEEHLWSVWDEKKYETRKKKVIDTNEISKTFKHRKTRNRYAIDNCKPLKLRKKKLPIHPYLLGVWLGDGNSNGNRITSEINDAIELNKTLENLGYHVKLKPYKDAPHIVSLHIRKPDDECARGHKYNGYKVSGKSVCLECARQRYHGKLDAIKHQRIGEVFEKLNLYGNKHIPKSYLRGSYNQRLELLQGLMDTDGTIDENGHCEFYQVDETLSLQVYELICSLGLKPTIKLRDNKGKLTNITDKRYKMQDIYRISFKAFSEMPVFKLSRKKNRLKSKTEIRFSEISRRRIVNVVECESVPVRCITVDTPTHLFLAGESMIPTHNSTGVIEAGIGWIVSQNPGNILFLVGHEDLVKDAMKKVDRMIDNSGIRQLIKSTSGRKRNTKSGDTDQMKEFADGYLKLGISNHKTLRNISMQYGFIDDFEGMKGSTKEAGATQKMIEQRFAAFAKKMKLFYISTPELEETSNIEPVYKLGDQRKYHIPCPCCGEFIALEWAIKSESKPNEMAGITWELDNENQLIPDSVGYTCQKCGGFFDDTNKTELIQLGTWIPTAKPSQPGYYSYHISALYAPIYMYGWEHYVRDYLESNPVNGKRDEEKWKTFKNLVLGETYAPTGESISANELQRNIRPYEIGVVPEKLSIADGNGKIVMLTCGCDLNGKENDARLDYEIVAHSESGATYSVEHGSIGTFIPKDKHPEIRDHWSYKHGVRNCVWIEFEQILSKKYERDVGPAMKIFFTGVDTGYQTSHAYQFVDNTNLNVVSLKGKDDEKFVNPYADVKTFKQSREKGNLYLVETNYTKDTMSHHMGLKWNPDQNAAQPFGFMNFPTPSDGKYLYSNYFSHFEAEHKVIDKNGTYRWLKKSNQHQNHLFDCRLYAIVARDILLDKVFKEIKVKNGVWSDYVKLLEKK